jgi:uncharacterized protein YndB with AHSA1/START domain
VNPLEPDPLDRTDEPAARREIVARRVLDAPRERVFAALADPAQLARWWGPAGFTNTFEEFDFRPGGPWRLVMHGPDGNDYPNESEFVEIVPPSRLVLVHLRPMHQFRLTITLDDEAGRTRLTWRMLFDSIAERERMMPYIPAANEQNLDRLAAVIALPANRP